MSELSLESIVRELRHFVDIKNVKLIDTTPIIRPRTFIEVWQVINFLNSVNYKIIVKSKQSDLDVPKSTHIAIICTKLLKKHFLLENNSHTLVSAGVTFRELNKTISAHNIKPLATSAYPDQNIISSLCSSKISDLTQSGLLFSNASIYIKIDEQNNVVLVNNLGIEGDSEEVLKQLDSGDVKITLTDNLQTKDDLYTSDFANCTNKPARDANIAAFTVDANGCMGNIFVLAAVFKNIEQTQTHNVLHISTNNLEALQSLQNELFANFKQIEKSFYVNQELINETLTKSQDLIYFNTKAKQCTWYKKCCFRCVINTINKIARSKCEFAQKLLTKILQKTQNVEIPSKLNEIYKNYKYSVVVYFNEANIDWLLDFMQKNAELSYINVDNNSKIFIECLKSFAIKHTKYEYFTTSPTSINLIQGLQFKENDKYLFLEPIFGFFVKNVFACKLTTNLTKAQINNKLNEQEIYIADKSNSYYTASDEIVAYYQSINPSGKFVSISTE